MADRINLTGLSLSTGPTVEPLSLAEAKQYARVDEVADDNLILDILIPAARQYVERATNRQLINATWAMTLDEFPSEIVVPKPPLSSVTSIQYIDTNGTTQTEAASVYTVLTDIEPGRIVEAYSQTWSSTRSVPEAVTVTFVAGYGAAAANVPEPLRHACALLVNHWYDNRESVLVGSISKNLEHTLQALIQSYKVYDVPTVMTEATTITERG